MLKFLLLLLLPFFAAAEIDLSVYEKGLYSPHGEDGILATLFAQLPTDKKICVEFNVKNGVVCSSTLLLRKQGWKGILFDRGEEIPSIGLYKEFVNAGNVSKFFEKYNVPEQFELLAIHVGYNEFHIWNALDPKYRPSVVMIEYNGYLPPDEDRVAKYRPFYLGDSTDYFGASILAFFNLGKAKGYTLVYADLSGSTLFFVRNDLAEGLDFKNAGNPEELHRFPTAKRKPDVKQREYLASRELLDPKETP